MQDEGDGDCLEYTCSRVYVDCTMERDEGIRILYSYTVTMKC